MASCFSLLCRSPPDGSGDSCEVGYVGSKVGTLPHHPIRIQKRLRMAGKSTEQADIEELIRISDQARGELGVKIVKLRRTLDVPTRVVGSLRSNPKSWLLGSMAAGLFGSVLLSRVPRRRKKKKEDPFNLKKAAFSLTLTAVRPVAKVWLANKLKSMSGKWIADRVNGPSEEPSPFQIEPDRTRQILPDPPPQGKPEQNPEHVRTSGP